MRSRPIAVLTGVAIMMPTALALGRDLRGRPAAWRPGQTRTIRIASVRDDSLRVHTQRGSEESQAEISEPAGVIRRFRVVAAKGIHVTVTSVIPGLAGVSTAIPRPRQDPSSTCTHSGDAVACTQAEEWCPMPAASWRIRVRKHSGPAGWIRVTFAVGPAPRGR